jgi:hypothetical protein
MEDSVFKDGHPTVFDGDQMVYVMRLRRVILVDEAVFAAAQRSLDDQTAKMIGDVYSRHGDSSKQMSFQGYASGRALALRKTIRSRACR